MGAQWKVKHKEAAANAKGKIFGKLVKEITIAARNWNRFMGIDLAIGLTDSSNNNKQFD